MLWIVFHSVAQGMNNDSELLPEDEAFAFSAELLPDKQLAVRWKIADGYYMYRDKISFEVQQSGVLETVELPPGKPKEDVLFGNVQVYTEELNMVLPLLKGDSTFTLLAKGQGCNEPVGVCYPPIEHEINFTPGSTANASPGAVTQLPGQDVNILGVQQSTIDNLFERTLAASTMQSATSDIPESTIPPTPIETDNQTTETPDQTTDLESVQQLRDLLSSGFEQPEYLAVEEAFKLSVRQVDAQTLLANFKVADGYYLYREKIELSATGYAQIGEFDLPPGEVKEDQYIGRTNVLRKSFEFPIRLSRGNPDSGLMSLQVIYQGCAEQGICYPPVTSNQEFKLPALISEATAQTIDTTPLVSASIAAPTATSSSTSADKRTLSTLLLGAFLAGVLLTFTPCVLPMIPILSSVIAGQGEQLTRMRGGMLAIFYVIGTAVTYAAMGAIAGATGEQLQAYFQNAWAIGILAVIFVLMAFSMFGTFQFQMPASVQSRLQTSTGNMRGSIPLVFILGLVSALIVGACVSPVLISFLGIAVTKADPALGAQIMFAMALGMGLPLIALGFGAGYLIPRAGAWMETVKHVFGVMLIAVAIYILGVLPQVPVLLLWGVFLIVLSTFLGATQSLPADSSGSQRIAKGLGTVLLVWGVMALFGGFYGQRDLLRPLPESLFANSPTSQAGVDAPHLFKQIDSLSTLAIEMDKARSDGKNVMIDFYADWCVDCIKMEKSTFNDPAIVSALQDSYVALQVDVTDPKDPGTSAVKKQLGVFGPPAVLFFDRNGNPLTERNFYGYRNSKELLALLSNQ